MSMPSWWFDPMVNTLGMPGNDGGVNARLDQSATNSVAANNALADQTFQQGQDDFWKWSDDATRINAAYVASNLAVGPRMPVGTYVGNALSPFATGTAPIQHLGGTNGLQKFNPGSYLVANPDVFKAGADPWQHYNQYGQNEGRTGAWDTTTSFNTSNYLANNPDVFKAGADPIQHWLLHGYDEGRTGGFGGPDFNESNYLEHNPDVLKSGMDPTGHWLQYGSQEGRAGAWGANDFNASNYLANNPDVWAAGASPLQHWLDHGYNEGRTGAFGENLFNAQGYSQHNPDVVAAGWDPTAHWLQHGSQEGRTGGWGDDAFNPQEYLLQNRDVAATNWDPLQHWMTHGYNEGREVAFGGTEADDWSEYFSQAGTGNSRDAIAAAYLAGNKDVFDAAQASGQDPTEFANQHIMAYGEDEDRTFFDRFHYNQLYPDVAASGMDPTAHWFQYGQKEGRTMPQSSVFNMETYKLLNPDVAAAGVDPLQHWLTYGQKENRMGGAFESAQSYFDLPGTTYREPWIAAIPENRRTAETVTAVKNLAEQYGWSPAAMAAVIFMETGNTGANSWNPLINQGSTETKYRGLTQMGPAPFTEAGGRLGGLTWEQYQRATPAQQIAAYGAWLDYYARSPNSAAALVKGGIGSLPPEMQAAIMQATQFSPSGKYNGVSWVDALGQGNMSMPVTTPYEQAAVLKDTSIETMRNAFAEMMMNWPQYQSPWPLQ